MSDGGNQQQSTAPTETGAGESTSNTPVSHLLSFHCIWHRAESVPLIRSYVAQGPHVSALPAFARGGRALETAERLDREGGHTEASAAAGGAVPGKYKLPYQKPGTEQS